MTTGEMEWSDIGREHGPKVAMMWVGLLIAVSTFDWLVIRALIHMVKLWAK